MNSNTWLAAAVLSGSTLSALACSDVPSTPSTPLGSGGVPAARGGAAGTPSTVSGGSMTLPGSGGVSAGGTQGLGGAGSGAPPNGLGGTPGLGGFNTWGGNAGSLSGGAGFGGQSPAGGSGNGGLGAGGKAASGGQSSGGSMTGGANGNSGGAISTKGGAGGTPGSGKGGAAMGGAATGGAATGGQGSGGKASTGGAAGGGTTNDRCDVAVYDSSTPPKALTLTGNLGTHDPVLIFAHNQYYLFQTGPGVFGKTSTNLTSWQGSPAVFGSNPGWISQQVPGATDLWAPDISYFGGTYHLYYSASTFGANRSCIGHATRAALNSGSWADQGSVVCSNPGGGSADNWNAIDPNVIVDEAGTPWLSFGSFWGGLKLVKLTSAGARADTTLVSIAARPSNGGALEAPFIVRRCGYYYLFVSFDTCCAGVNSTYKIMVGRSASVTGPYVDKAGTAMMQGGGTLLVQGDARWKGPGHNAVIFTATGAYNVYHSYDANNNGNATLRVSDLAWDTSGWPISGGP